MPKLAKIENDVVINVILGDAFPDYVTCTDDVQIGWMHDGETFTTPPELTNRPNNEVLRTAINVERQRRINAGNIIAVTGTAGIPSTGRDEDQRNLLGLVTAAQLRIAAGDTTTLTVFRDRDNSMHDLIPAQIIELWQGGAAYISSVYAASWAIKAIDPIPLDYADDSRWPAYS